jgi:hypothetical protein
MPTRIRTNLAQAAARTNREQLFSLGSAVRAARLRRRWTQATLGAKVGGSQSAISRAERGLGGGLTLGCMAAWASVDGTRIHPWRCR